MQSWCLLGPLSTSDAGGGGAVGGLFLPSRKPDGRGAFTWSCRIRRSAVRAGPIAAGEQDHYAVLRVPRSASSADVKRAYRLLARKYHPDVSRESQAAEAFKSIRLAYEVLSDEVTRAKYDMRLKFPTDVEEAWRGKWTDNHESDERKRMRRWAAKMRQHMYEKQSRENSWYDQSDAYLNNSDRESRSFLGVLQFALLTLLFMRIVGCRITLAFCGLIASADMQLDGGYKMGYLMAWFLGGRGGIFLALCINFTSWLCGKNSSSYIAVVVLATWMAANLTRFIPLPQGAVLALLYMSIKLQVLIPQLLDKMLLSTLGSHLLGGVNADEGQAVHARRVIEELRSKFLEETGRSGERCPGCVDKVCGVLDASDGAAFSTGLDEVLLAIERRQVDSINVAARVCLKARESAVGAVASTGVVPVQFGASGSRNQIGAQAALVSELMRVAG